MRFTAEDRVIIKYLNECMYLHYKADWRAKHRGLRPRINRARHTRALALLRDLEMAYSTYQELVKDLEEERTHATGKFPELQEALEAVAKLAKRTREAMDAQAKNPAAIQRTKAKRQRISQRRRELRRQQRRLKWRKHSPTWRPIRGYKHEFNR